MKSSVAGATLVLVGLCRATAAQPPGELTLEAELGVSVVEQPSPCDDCGHLVAPLVAIGASYRLAPSVAAGARAWIARSGREAQHFGGSVVVRWAGPRWRIELAGGPIDLRYYSGDGGTLGGVGVIASLGAAVAVTRGPAVTTWLSARAARGFFPDDARDVMGELAYGVSW